MAVTPAQRSHVKRPRAPSDVELPTAAKKSRRKAKNEDKENLSVGELDLDNEIINSCQWSVGDRTKLFTWLLGPEANVVFEKIKKSPTYVYKKVRF